MRDQWSLITYLKVFHRNLIMCAFVLQCLCSFATETCVEFDQTGHNFNWTLAKNATSPVREFWEWVWIKNWKIWQKALKVWLNYDWQCDLQEKSFECHRKCPWVGRHSMGVGPVSSVVLDHLLLLRLERSKVHREGSAITFFNADVSSSCWTVKA